jgi:oligopeptide transport system substrate-binding protein
VKNLFLLFLFLNILFNASGYANPKNDSIVYFCGNKFEYPWLENASYDCWSSFMTAVMGTLISIDNNGDIKPYLLESFDWDFEKNYYKLRLRKNLYFQNGRKVTVEDLEFSILRPFFASKPSDGSIFLFDLKGIEKIQHGQSYKSGLVEGIQILDDRTVSFAPTKFNPVFLYNLATAHYSLAPREEYESDLVTWKKWPIGVGAYRVTGEDKKNRGYYLSLVDEKSFPKAPKTIFYEQERGFEPDITTKDSISAKEKKYKKEKLLIHLSKRIIAFNFSSNLGNSKDFRKAISLALSRSEISNSTDIVSLPLYEIITRGNVGRINVNEKNDIKEASQIFKKILGTKHKKIFKIPYSPDNSYLGYRYKEIIKFQLEKAGLNVEFYEMNNNLWNIFSKDFKSSPFCLVSMMGNFIDPRPTFYAYKNGTMLTNTYNPNSSKLEKLLENAKEAGSRKELNDKVEELSLYYHENFIVVPLFEVPNIAYYNPEKISSIGTQIGASMFYLHNLEIKDK